MSRFFAVVLCALVPLPAAAGCVVSVFFDFASARLTPDTRAVLDRVAAVHPGAPLRILGHGDAPGSEFENLVISRARAEAVSAYLAARGLTGTVAIAAQGQTDLVVIDHGKVRRNRRVELYLPSCSSGLF